MTSRTLTLADFDDVDVEHPLTARRIPVLPSLHTRMRWKFHVALVIGGDSWEAGGGVEPTEQEADQLCVYLEKRLRYYNDAYRRRMTERAPFDLDGTVNTYTFRKHSEHGWQYNAATWSSGPTWFPSPFADPIFEPRTLEALLDQVNSFGDSPPSQEWLDLKAESGVFEEVSPRG